MRCTSVLLLAVSAAFPCSAKLPNLAFVLVDDLGFNDMSWGGERSTDLKAAWPNADKMAAEGVRIDNYYTMQLCSPTRGAFLTGRHPIRLGLTHGVLQAYQDWGIPENDTTIADKLHAEGYRCYGVGKWHVGYYSWDVAPLGRGFDHYYGYMNGAEDYLTHFVQGYLDLLDDKVADWSQNGSYSAFVFQKQVERRLREHAANYSTSPFFLYYPMQTVHAPLEALSQYSESDACKDIPNTDRKTFCGMASAADDALGQTVNLIDTLFPSEDSVIVVGGDNGGMPSAAGNNWPLRGHKAELWEGGVRNNAIIRSRTLIPASRHGKVWSGGLMHVMDWHATLRDLGGGSDKAGFATDGMSMWDAILNDKASPRTEFPINIDPVTNERAFRMGKWKLLLGVNNDTWYSVPTSAETRWSENAARSGPSGSVLFPPSSSTLNALFDISADPNEHNNVYDANPDVVATITKKLDSWAAQARPLTTGWDSSDPAATAQAAKYYSLYPWK